MTDLYDIVPSLKRAVAPPGRFERFFPEATDADLVAQLQDGLGRAQLDGFLGSYTPNLADDTVAPDLNGAQSSLVVLYASRQMLEADVRNRKSHTRYEAKGVVSEVDDLAASIMVQLLKDTKAQIDEIKLMAQRGQMVGAFYMADQYVARVSEGWRDYSFDAAYDYNALAAGGL